MGSLYFMAWSLVRALAIGSAGIAVSCLGLIIYLGVIGDMLRRSGIAPEGWFGHDYTDPAGGGGLGRRRTDISRPAILRRCKSMEPAVGASHATRSFLVLQVIFDWIGYE